MDLSSYRLHRMDPEMTGTRRLMIVAGAAVATAAIVLAGWWAMPETVSAGSPPESLVDALARAGILLESTPPSALTDAPLIAASTAEQSARAVFEGDAPAAVFVGQLTVEGYLDSDGKGLVRRTAYAVVFSGLHELPMGVYGDPPPDESMVHEEEVVFIDGATGAFLLSVSVR